MSSGEYRVANGKWQASGKRTVQGGVEIRNVGAYSRFPRRKPMGGENLTLWSCWGNEGMFFSLRLQVVSMIFPKFPKLSLYFSIICIFVSFKLVCS
jgi:hypothetical protein